MSLCSLLLGPIAQRTFSSSATLHKCTKPTDQESFITSFQAMRKTIMKSILPRALPAPAARTICVVCLILAATASLGVAEYTFNPVVCRYGYRFPEHTVIGMNKTHTIRPKDTLLDIARYYELGFNELQIVYRTMDPWIPPKDQTIVIPTEWVLPPTKNEQIVINIPELRLYFFDKKTKTVETYPIGIGDEGWETPVGTFTITSKRIQPTWYVPKSLQPEYGTKVMPPGPENPLGEYAMNLSGGAYTIHGTNIPWGVGRLTSHGCIRMYPEHIRLLFPQVKLGARVEIIYEPVKLGKRDGHIYVEANPDVYKKIPDYLRYAMEKLRAYPWADKVDQEKFMKAVLIQNGIPVDVTLTQPETVAAGLTSQDN